jgi:hypothetical protein
MFEEKHKLYDYINSHLIDNAAVDFLEFGVYRGDSIKYWMSLNALDTSRFWGFDTFTGLPESWEKFSGKVEKGSFDTGGNSPDIVDNRVVFVKGLFQNTVPAFLERYEKRNQIIIHNDADLYSSTLYVLTQLNPILGKDAIVIFDEFYSLLHEFRALEDYCAAYSRTYRILAATQNYAQIAIRMN